jgi:hypothetical protein
VVSQSLCIPRIEQFLKQYAKSSTRLSYQSGVLAFLSFIYGFNRKGKRISDEEKVKLETLAYRFFVGGRDCKICVADTSGRIPHTTR